MKRVLFGIAALILVGCAQPVETTPEEHDFRTSTAIDEGDVVVTMTNAGTAPIDGVEITVYVTFVSAEPGYRSFSIGSMAPGSSRDYTLGWVDRTAESAYVTSRDIDWAY